MKSLPKPRGCSRTSAGQGAGARGKRMIAEDEIIAEDLGRGQHAADRGGDLPGDSAGVGVDVQNLFYG